MTINRAYHLNVNCSDLARSEAFYCGLLGLTKATRTSPSSPQPGRAFGLVEVQWDAWILQGDQPGGVVLDLLEWLVPTPSGAPATATDDGFTSVQLTHPDLDRLERALRGASVDLEGHVDGIDVADPDGVRLEIRPGAVVAITGVRLSTPHLDATAALFCAGLGFEPSGDDGVLVHRSNGFAVTLVSSTATVRSTRVANELGIFRLACITDDIAHDHQRLVSLGAVALSDPVSLDMGPGLPSALLASFLRDSSGACVELIEAPRAVDDVV